MTGRRPFPSLETERLHLRPFSVEDAGDVFSYASDPEVVAFLSWPVHKDIGETRQIIRTHLMGEGTYAIEEKEGHAVIGCIDLRLQTDKTASFGYVLGKCHWHHGYMTEALAALIHHAFSDLGISSMEGCSDQGNRQSACVMERCGMKHTHLARRENQNGRISDYDHYRIDLHP